MALAGNGGILVPAPQCADWPGGLVEASEFVELGDNAWLRGLEFEQELCVTGGPRVLAMPCPPPVEQMGLDRQRGFDVEYVDPFVIYQGYDCSAAGSPLSEGWDHADRIFEDGWEWSLERAFWTGLDQDGNSFRMSLAGDSPTDLTPGGGAVSVAVGVSLLEQHAADFPCAPVIHAPVATAAFLAEKAQLRHSPDGGTTTALGTPVVFGQGYPLTGPGGSAPAAGEAWMFASGSVRITTGPKFYLPTRGDDAAATNRVTNDVQVYVQKGFAIERGCGLAAVRVLLAGPS